MITPRKLISSVHSKLLFLNDILRSSVVCQLEISIYFDLRMLKDNLFATSQWSTQFSLILRDETKLSIFDPDIYIVLSSANWIKFQIIRTFYHIVYVN